MSLSRVLVLSIIKLKIEILNATVLNVKIQWAHVDFQVRINECRSFQTVAPLDLQSIDGQSERLCAEVTQHTGDVRNDERVLQYLISHRYSLRYQSDV